MLFYPSFVAVYIDDKILGFLPLIWKIGMDRESIVGKLKPTAAILEWRRSYCDATEISNMATGGHSNMAAVGNNKSIL